MVGIPTPVAALITISIISFIHATTSSTPIPHLA